MIQKLLKTILFEKKSKKRVKLCDSAKFMVKSLKTVATMS